MVAHALAGRNLGRYQVIKYLASGGMAQVLLARSTGIEGFERHVVIKRIHPERALDEQAVKMFLDEARIAASLHHANIVQVHDIGQENEEYFFAMEYIHGEDLRRLLTLIAGRHGRIPFEHIVTIISASAGALHYAHDHRGLGIVHRDVSPANILVGYDGGVKVVDFGIAKAALRSQETQSGTLKGKISYMSPEQCMGQHVDRRSDVFALGICLYELMTVRRLFKGSSDFLTMSQIVAGNVPPPSEHTKDIPPALEQIVMKALELDPKNRFQSAEEMRMALDKCGPRSSSNELADYMRSVFGYRVEPWLVDEEDDMPEISVVDFDGADTGIAGKPDRMLNPPPGSLMARVKRKAANPVGVPVMTLADLGEPPAPADDNWDDPANQGVARAQPKTRTWRATLARHKRWVIAAAAAGVLAIGAVIVVTQISDDEPQAVAQPLPLPTLPPPQPAPAPVAEQVKPRDPAPVNKAPVARTTKKTKKKTPTKTNRKWDPTTLLPD